MTETVRGFLEGAALSREVVDRFLDPSAPNYASFHSVCGYVPKTCVIKDGIDGSLTTYTHPAPGHRLVRQFADRPCRFNTYGDSFTQCNQVRDGETWQEYLAAHLGEPIRNFGVGGYGFYQAVRRMLCEESTSSSAAYVLINVFSDDHFRSIYPWRMLHLGGELQFLQDNVQTKHVAFPFTFTGPWAHLCFDADSGAFEEIENPHPTPGSLYDLCDPERVYESFRGALSAQVAMARRGAPDIDLKLLARTADAVDFELDVSTSESASANAHGLLRTCALRSSQHVVDLAVKFAEDHGKHLKISLSYGGQDVVHVARGGERTDQSFVDHLKERDLLLFDGIEAHVDEFADFRCSAEEYAARYYHGHYNARGNHFYAYGLKNPVVEWLEPKPPAYRDGGPI